MDQRAGRTTGAHYGRTRRGTAVDLDHRQESIDNLVKPLQNRWDK